MSTEYPNSDDAEQVYVDHDEDLKWFGVFGLDTGHCYAQYFDQTNANIRANTMNEIRTKRRKYQSNQSKEQTASV